MGVGAPVPSIDDHNNISGLHHANSGTYKAARNRNKLVKAIAALRDAGQDEIVQDLKMKLAAHDRNVAPQATNMGWPYYEYNIVILVSDIIVLWP
jgi:hypothetical protein